MIPANIEEDMRKLEIAQQIAALAHTGQTDKTGHDYIDHPRRVAENTMTVPHNPMGTHMAQLMTVAWLHDVLEDGPANGYTPQLDEWRAAGFSEDTIEAVQLLTYRKPHIAPGTSQLQSDAIIKQSKIDYYLRIADNHIARPVKLADLADNCNLQRQAELVASGAHHDPDKYPFALSIIDPTPEEWMWFNEAIKKQVS